MAIHDPLHPGEILKELLIEGAKLSVTASAERLGVNRTTLSRLLNGHAGVSPDMALRLSKLMPNTSMRFWLNIQRDYDISLVSKYAKKVKVYPLAKDQAHVAH